MGKDFCGIKKRVVVVVAVVVVVVLIAIGKVILFSVFHRHAESRIKSKIKVPLFLEYESDYYIYDSEAGHLHKPKAKRDFPWKEHIKGRIIMRTNNLGFREDLDTKAKKTEGIVRILVSGDSHLDGVVYNVESFPNRWEALLNKGQKNPRYECINGGIGCSGPQNYSGFLKRFLYLKPDVFVVVLYTGNDFLDAVSIEEFRERFQTPPRPPGYYDKMEAAVKKLSCASHQILNQVVFFKTFPSLISRAIEITGTHFEIIKSICKDNNIKLLVVLLPTKLDVEAQFDRDRIKAVNEILQLSKKDFGINRRLTKLFIAWLVKNKIDYIDLYPFMKGGNQELFWKKDYHLNDAGHRRIADIVYHTSYKTLFGGHESK
jgi:lysophospholipase L1-like esterase